MPFLVARWQDYIGSFVPSGSGFKYKEGVLVQAMQKGYWFLADEFNLADPAVMSTLAPLLEGTRELSIPGRAPVRARPGFRFFATQNAAKYAGRNKLPETLRSRFLEAQVQDFDDEEIELIFNRKFLTTVRASGLTWVVGDKR
eukprot:2359290-Prymnesium_polylepis.1